jgi:TIR domain
MAKIVISYRRADSETITGRIRDHFALHYGEDSVFMDIDSIPLGIDYRKQISDALAQNGILVVIIGPKWRGPLKGGQCRLDSDADPVRVEVATALERGIPTIPVLVNGAAMPKAEDLPDNLKILAFHNAAEIDVGRDFHQHMARLIRSMDLIVKPEPRAAAPWWRRKEFAIGAAAVIVLALGSGAYLKRDLVMSSVPAVFRAANQPAPPTAPSVPAPAAPAAASAAAAVQTVPVSQPALTLVTLPAPPDQPTAVPAAPSTPAPETVSLGAETPAVVNAPAESDNPPPSPPSTAIQNESRHQYELAALVGTLEGWDAFLREHAEGFYANLARAARAKLLATAPPAQAPTSPAPSAVAALPADSSTKAAMPAEPNKPAAAKKIEREPARRTVKRDRGDPNSFCGHVRWAVRAATAAGFDNGNGIIAAARSQCGG